MDLSKRMRQIRKDKGLTQKELADLTGKGIATIIRYENDYLNTIFEKDIVEIANQLGVSVPYFLGLTDQEQPIKEINHLDNDLVQGDQIAYVFSSHNDNDQYVYFVIADDSYLPIWPKGTKCLIKKSEMIENGMVVLVHTLEDNQFMIRKYHQEKDLIVLVPLVDATHTDKIIYQTDDIEILGNVTQITYDL